jgi:phenylalanyl-tRNA synthetase alpha subunit
MAFKQKVYHSFHQSITGKVAVLNRAMNDLNESSKNETKSSAGDKYETTRAMLQLEKDKVVAQLKEAQQQKALLEQIGFTLPSNKIEKGSLVKTNKGYLFMSLAMGKMVVDGNTVISLSAQSPLGAKLMGLASGISLTFNGVDYSIETIE